MGIKEDMHEEMETIKGDLATVSKAFHELQTEKNNSIIKRYRITIAVLALLLILSNSLWLIYRITLEKVVETTTTETYTFEGIEQNAEGSNYIVGGDINGNAEN